MKILINEKNKEKINKFIKEAEGKAKVRTADFSDAVTAVKMFKRCIPSYNKLQNRFPCFPWSSTPL